MYKNEPLDDIILCLNIPSGLKYSVLALNLSKNMKYQIKSENSKTILCLFQISVSASWRVEPSRIKSLLMTARYDGRRYAI